MPKYKNIGIAPWRRASGELVPPGATFEATAREHARILRRLSYQKRLRLVDPPEKPSLSVDGWPLKMTPEKYLALHSDGKHASLAKELIEIKEGEEKEGAA